MAEPTELADLEAAVAAAFAAEQGSADQEPPQEVAEQPEGGDEAPQEEADELFADMEDEPSAQSEEVPTSFELPGVETPVSLDELKNGYLRHRDYTQKTQALAEVRKVNEKALKFWEAIQSDPVAAVTQLAIEAGLVAEGAKPIKAVDFAVLSTADDIEAEIAKRVEEAVQKHPLVTAAAQTEARRMVDDEFARIETTYGVKLGPKTRMTILKTANDRKVGDLEMVYNSLSAQKAKKAEAAQKLKDASPGRATGRATEKELSEEVADVEDAFKRALAESAA